jgi:hypothetical protein
MFHILSHTLMQATQGGEEPPLHGPQAGEEAEEEADQELQLVS